MGPFALQLGFDGRGEAAQWLFECIELRGFALYTVCVWEFLFDWRGLLLPLSGRAWHAIFTFGKNWLFFVENFLKYYTRFYIFFFQLIFSIIHFEAYIVSQMKFFSFLYLWRWRIVYNVQSLVSNYNTHTHWNIPNDLLIITRAFFAQSCALWCSI